MSFQLSILGWSASNLRCPDHQISLCQKDSQTPLKVTFIQMPNGTGKTTTLDLLRATLSGSAKQWSSQQIAEFRNVNNSVLTGIFIVRLTLNEQFLTFELNFDFEQNKVNYRTTYGSGIKDGFQPPSSIKKFLNPEFINLFVFNGELARNLLDAKQTRARDAIDSLFQLSLLQDIADKFQENWEDHIVNASSISDMGLQRRKNRLQKLKDRKKEVEARKKQLNLQKSRLEIDTQQAQQEYDVAFNKDKDLGTKLKDLQVKLTKAEKTVSSEIQQSIERMRNPQQLVPGFGVSLLNLKNNLDSLKLPNSTSQEFFAELAQAEECVCGRPMDNESSKNVRERASQYLAEDEVGVLNGIKSDIAKHCGTELELYAKKLDRDLKDLGQSIKLRDNLSTEISSIQKQRLDQGDSELEDKKQKLDKLQTNLENCKTDLKEILRVALRNPSDDTKCLQELKNLIKKAEDDVAEATNTITLKNKTEIIQNILTQSQQTARDKLRKYIIDKTNQRISQLLNRNPVILEDIQDSLKLKQGQGASEGQTLSVSYAFLATLFAQSTYQLPFIVDSPVISLDLNVRREVARLIPSLFKQFLAFTISSEREGFINVFDQTVNSEVKYLTLFRKTSEIKYLWQDINRTTIRETTDGILIEGKEFFDKFDLDSEV